MYTKNLFLAEAGLEGVVDSNKTRRNYRAINQPTQQMNPSPTNPSTSKSELHLINTPHGVDAPEPNGFNTYPVAEGQDMLDIIRNEEKNISKIVDHIYSPVVNTDNCLTNIFPGNLTTTTGSVVRDPSGSFIPGIAFAKDNSPTDPGVDSEQVVIMPTSNSGFHYVGEDEKGRIRDIGPVSNPVIVGDANQPSALLVPFNSKEAIEDSIDFLTSMSDKYLEVAENTIEIESDRLMEADQLFSNHLDDCKRRCNGGYFDNGNCPCHHQ